MSVAGLTNTLKCFFATAVSRDGICSASHHHSPRFQKAHGSVLCVQVHRHDLRRRHGTHIPYHNCIVKLLRVPSPTHTCITHNIHQNHTVYTPQPKVKYSPTQKIWLFANPSRIDHPGGTSDTEVSNHPDTPLCRSNVEQGTNHK
jgi:hypothetical protein